MRPQSDADVLKPKRYGAKVLQLREVVSQPVFASFCAGGVAGAVSRTVVSPLERLKILFQIQSVGREEYKLSVGKGLMKMWKDEGWRGFMRGNGTNCIRIVPYSAVQFGSYNFYKKVSIQPATFTLCGATFSRQTSHSYFIFFKIVQLLKFNVVL
jgi:solute carrier family 25 phosphate transporter 23/24/25/41